MSTRLLVIVLSIFLFAGCSSRRGIYHTVGEGQTLYRISQAYGVDPGQLARTNGINDPSRLKVGQRLFVAGASRTRSVTATVAAKPPPAKADSVIKSAPVKPALSASPAPSVNTPPAPVKGKFGYPIQGRIVKEFGEHSGEISRGVEFSAKRGTPVVAAAAGRVIYSGNGIKGYGYLIIIKHADSFYTVYGYNENNLVAAGVDVNKGGKIALCGVPPSGGEARLHFEIRVGKNAVNPIFYLP